MTNSLETLKGVRAKVRKETRSIRLIAGATLVLWALLFFEAFTYGLDSDMHGLIPVLSLLIWVELRIKKKVTLPILDAVCDLEKRLAKVEAEEGGSREALED